METKKFCPECGANCLTEQTCINHFYQMGGWELDHQLYEVHHLMVLCYYLQHPSLYSPKGLQEAKKLLVAFLEEGIDPQQLRYRIGKQVDSGKRTYKITGTPAAQGSYIHPVCWSMTAADVIGAGMDHYYAQVKQWANTVLKSLRDSKEL